MSTDTDEFMTESTILCLKEITARPAPLTELNIKRKGMFLSLHMFAHLCTLFIFMASIKDIITMLCCVVDGSVRF